MSFMDGKLFRRLLHLENTSQLLGFDGELIASFNCSPNMQSCHDHFRSEVSSEQDVLNGWFDWHYYEQSAVKITLDSGAPGGDSRAADHVSGRDWGDGVVSAGFGAAEYAVSVQRAF